MKNIWKLDEIEVLKAFIESGWSHKDTANELNRSISAVATKCSDLKIVSKYNTKRTPEQYQKELPNSIIALEDYVNAHINILHKHSCGYEWKAEPNSILKGRGCPKCAKYGFDESAPATTYCIYFPNLDLYKIGITNNLKRRMQEYAQDIEVILTHTFSLGKDAKYLEKQWLCNVNHLKYNTGILRTGNTETFKL